MRAPEHEDLVGLVVMIAWIVAVATVVLVAVSMVGCGDVSTTVGVGGESQAPGVVNDDRALDVNVNGNTNENAVVGTR